MALLVSSDEERQSHHKKLPFMCLNVSPNSLRLWRPWLKLAAICNDHSICFQLPCFSAQIYSALPNCYHCRARSTNHAIQNSQFWTIQIKLYQNNEQKTALIHTNTKVCLSTLERFQELELSWICCSKQVKLAFFGIWIFLWTWTSANWATRWDFLLEVFEAVLLGESRRYERLNVFFTCIFCSEGIGCFWWCFPKRV